MSVSGAEQLAPTSVESGHPIPIKPKQKTSGRSLRGVEPDASSATAPSSEVSEPKAEGAPTPGSGLESVAAPPAVPNKGGEQIRWAARQLRAVPRSGLSFLAEKFGLFSQKAEDNEGERESTDDDMGFGMFV